MWANIDQFQKKPGPDWRRRQFREDLRSSDDVEDTGDAESTELFQAQHGSSEIVFIRKRALECVDALDPLGEAAWRQQRSSHKRVIEVTVRINQTGKYNDVTQIFYRAGVRSQNIPCPSNRTEPISVHYESAVIDGFAIH